MTMQTKTISENAFERISNAADRGSYTHTVVSLLTPNLNEAECAQDAGYLVIENAYFVTIIELDTQGRPAAILERE